MRDLKDQPNLVYRAAGTAYKLGELFASLEAHLRACQALEQPIDLYATAWARRIYDYQQQLRAVGFGGCMDLFADVYPAATAFAQGVAYAGDH